MKIGCKPSISDSAVVATRKRFADSMENPDFSWQRPLAQLSDILLRSAADHAAMDAVRQLLESLPLTTSEFGLARSRLSNIVANGEAGEWGAVKIEW